MYNKYSQFPEFFTLFSDFIIIKTKRKKPLPIVLILSPTRELALQCDSIIESLSTKFYWNHCCIYGGNKREDQIQKLKNRPEIVISTPGRLIDFIDNGLINLNKISYLVIDEADRMLDKGFVGILILVGIGILGILGLLLIFGVVMTVVLTFKKKKNKSKGYKFKFNTLKNGSDIGSGKTIQEQLAE